MVFSLFLTPIGLLLKVVDLPETVSYQGLTGTLWSGTAQVVEIHQGLGQSSGNNAGKNIQLKKFSWSLNGLPLFMGKLSFDVKFGNAREADEMSGKGRLALGLNSFNADSFTFRAPAHMFKSQIPFPLGDIGGRIILNAQEYKVGFNTNVDANDEVQSDGQHLCDVLTGDLMWTNSEIDFGGPVTFGTIVSSLSCNDQAINALFDGENKLGLSGNAIIASPKSVRFDGFMKPDADLPREIHNGLGMFSRLDPQGRYPIKL